MAAEPVILGVVTQATVLI